MEAQIEGGNQHIILKYLVFSENVFIITTFLSFIDPGHLRPIVEVALADKRSQKFYRIAVARLFVGCYLNRVDRSVFFLFYEEIQFQSIERQTINAMASSNYQFLEKAFLSFKEILQQFSEQMSFLTQKQQFISIIDTIFFEPDIPMPQMKRETIGMYCQTPFQHFLSLKRFQEEGLEESEWLDESLQELKTQLELQVATGFYSNTVNLQKLMQTVRFRGWLVDRESWRNYLVPGFHSHDLIVILTALSCELVETYSVFLMNINDPFMRFVEFNLRSIIFRNIMLTIEERLAFAINSYDIIYANTFNPPLQLPKYNFWRTGLSIWAQKMSGFHEGNRRIYDYITIKLRENSLLGYLSIKIERLPSVYSELRDEAELSGFSEVLKDQAYQETEGGLQLESFFDGNEEIYQVLAKDYAEYGVDMSINEVSVHWCGHSEHVIAQTPVFSTISSVLSEGSRAFYEDWREKINKTIPVDIKLHTLRELVKQDLRLLGQFIAKPITLRQITNTANKIIKQFGLQLGLNMQDQKTLAKYFIEPPFEQKDNLLSYFASKAHIEPNCLKGMQFFYDIQVDPKAEMPKVEIEIESASSQAEHEVYLSDSEI